jgi:KTSC domain
MATRKRVPVKVNTAADIQSVKNRKRLQVPAESSVFAIRQADKFSREQGQGDFIPLTYDPTRTTWPANGWPHRRTVAAGYDRSRGLLRIEFFSNGAVYDYGTDSPVPPHVAYQFRQVASPGRFINTTLERFGYSRVS